MADNALKQPLSVSFGRFTANRANDFSQPVSKGIPCTVTKINKDVLTVNFDGSNGVWTLPTREIPQAFSPYGRDPTQVGDKGYASPSDYYLGGISDLGGGQTNYAMRGNLTPLSFHPISRTNSEKRDYDQSTYAGGPNGVLIKQKAVQPKSTTGQQPGQPPGGGTTPPPSAMRHWSTAARRAWINRPIQIDTTPPGGGSGGSGGSTLPKDQAYIQIDKGNILTHVGADQKHLAIIDSGKKKIALNVPAKGSNAWLGGTGEKPELYAPVCVMVGGIPTPCVNVQGKYVPTDDLQQSGGGNE